MKIIDKPNNLRLNNAGLRKTFMYLVISIGTKSSEVNREAAFDCCFEETEGLRILMIRCLLLSIMAAIARSQYLSITGGHLESA